MRERLRFREGSEKGRRYDRRRQRKVAVFSDAAATEQRWHRRPPPPLEPLTHCDTGGHVFEGDAEHVDHGAAEEAELLGPPRGRPEHRLDARPHLAAVYLPRKVFTKETSTQKLLRYPRTAEKGLKGISRHRERLADFLV